MLLTTADPAELIAVEVSDSGLVVAGRAPLPANPIHITVDPTVARAAVSVGNWDEDAGLLTDTAITVIDLGDYSAQVLPIETGEPGVILTSGAVLHRNNEPAQMEAYALPGTDGFTEAMSSAVPIGASGHGEAFDPDRGRAFVATDDGIDVVAVEGTNLEYVTTLDWDTEDGRGGRAYYMRRSPDGALVSYVTDRSADAWGDWTSDAIIVDPQAEEVVRVPLGDGLVYRLGIGDGLALFFTQVPVEDPTGDQAHLVDIDRESPTFGTVVASIDLPALSQQGSSATSIWEAGELRIAAMSPDGAYGFVTNGGDGSISVIDTTAGEIVGTITVPTSLTGGGYLTTTQAGGEVADNIGR